MDSQCILQRILQASMGGELHQAGLSLKRRRGRNSVKSISTQHWLQRIQIIPTAQPGHGECKDVSTVRSSLLCGRAWWAPAVSGVTNTVWKFKEMEKGSLPVGSSITHSLARLSEVTLGCPQHWAPAGPSRCTMAEWSHEERGGINSRTRCWDQEATWRLDITSVFFCSSNLPVNIQERDPKHKTVWSSRSGHTKKGTQQWMFAGGLSTVLEEQPRVSYQSNG